AALGWTPVAGGGPPFLLTSGAPASRPPRAGRHAGGEGGGPAGPGVRRVDGQVVGSGQAAVDGDWLGVHGLVVEAQHRGQGHATAMMAGLLAWGAERGASTAWLHVETDNEPALALYDALGFRVHHTNRYLAAPG